MLCRHLSETSSSHILRDNKHKRICLFCARIDFWADKDSRFQKAHFVPQLDTKCFSVVSDGLAPNTVQLRPSSDHACQVWGTDFEDLKHPIRAPAQFNNSCPYDGKLAVGHFTWRPMYVLFLLATLHHHKSAVSSEIVLGCEDNRKE
jgi:hypothetical protein